MRRFFIPQFSIESASISLPREITHHLRTVLRLREGSEIVICDGAGGCYQCRIEGLDSKQGSATVVRSWVEEETALDIQLLQGLPHSDKFDLVLQKNTELGVSCFVPVRCERWQFALPAAKVARKLERWQKIVTEAARQSGRSWLPQVQPPQSLTEAVSRCDADLKLVLWEEATQPLIELLPEQPPRRVAVLIGPEGGLSRDEVASAESHGFVAAGLGPRILRTETAGLAISTILQYQYGDLGLVPKGYSVNE